MRLLITFILCAALHAQIIILPKKKAVACTTPTGTNLTESFGDAATSCWTSGPSTCDNTWTIGSGTVHSIISAPSGAPDNTVCSGALQFAETGNGEYLYKSITGKDVNTALDLEFYIRFSAWSVAAFDASQVMVVSNGNDLTSIRMFLSVRSTGSSFYGFRAGAGASSADDTTSLALNTWYKVNIHLETGTNMSSISVNGNTPSTFTQGAYNASYIGFGKATTKSQTCTPIIGNLRIS